MSYSGAATLFAVEKGSEIESHRRLVRRVSSFPGAAVWRPEWQTMRVVGGVDFVSRVSERGIEIATRPVGAADAQPDRKCVVDPKVHASISWMDVSADGKLLGVIEEPANGGSRVLCYGELSSGRLQRVLTGVGERAFWCGRSLVVLLSREDGTHYAIARVTLENGGVNILHELSRASWVELSEATDGRLLLLGETGGSGKRVWQLALGSEDSLPEFVGCLPAGSRVRADGDRMWYLPPGGHDVAFVDLREPGGEWGSVRLPDGFGPRTFEVSGGVLVAVGSRGVETSAVAVVSGGGSISIDLPSGCAIRAVPGSGGERGVELLTSSLAGQWARIRVSDDGLVTRDFVVHPDVPRVEVSRCVAVAFDGESVPVTLFHVGPLGPDRPCVLHVYGCYGLPLSPVFDPTIIPLLTEGVVVALAHVRGGGELGAGWHDKGRGRDKNETVYDFLSVANHIGRHGLVDDGFIVAQGASAGGFVAAAAAGLRPGLFRALHMVNPFLNVLQALMEPRGGRDFTDRAEFGDPANDPDVRSILELASPARWVMDGAASTLDVLIESRVDDKVVHWRAASEWLGDLERAWPQGATAPGLLHLVVGGNHRAGSNGLGAAFAKAWIMRLLARRRRVIEGGVAIDDHALT